MRYAALLRAINAGVKLPMADLRAFLTAQGLGEVRTLLASGNAVFTAAETDAAALAERLRHAAADALGIDTAWFLRNHAELAATIAANPFPDAARARPNLLLVSFHHVEVSAASVAALRHDGPERLAAVGRELYVDHVENVGRSKLPAALKRAGFSAEGTARNWNTVLKLAELTAWHARLLSEYAVDRLRQLDVAFGQALRVVCGERDLHAVPHVGPLGVMVHLLRDQRDLGHEAERLREVAERDLPRDRVARLVEVPVGQPVERVRALRLAQPIDHARLLAHAARPAIWPRA